MLFRSALYLSMLMQLERPYWALISAVFLQVRPETGLVIEKGLCQIGGTLVGGAMGLLILATLLPYPFMALLALTLWIGLNAAASAWVRQANFIYGFAMAGITATDCGDLHRQPHHDVQCWHFSCGQCPGQRNHCRRSLRNPGQ